MNQHLELTDELLVRALRRRTDVTVPSALLSRVMTGVTGMPQQPAPRRWLPSRGGTTVARRRPWLPAIPMPAIAGAAIAVAIFVAAVGLRPVLNGPGSTQTIAPTPSAVPSPSPTASASAPPPSPEARLLGTASALRLRLGNDVAPIDVVSAFGSIWIADIHANDVRRFDPTTLAEIARIPVPGGPAWFVEVGQQLWVSTQNGVGLARLDPATNTVVGTAGDAAPCAAPFVVGTSVWQSACDADAFLRLDAATGSVVQRYPAQGHVFLVAVGTRYYASGPGGLATWDPGTGSFTDLAAYTGPSEAVAVSDGRSPWVLGGSTVDRVDPADGHVVASFPYPGAVAVTFDAGRAWITTATDGVVAVDLQTNQVARTIAVPSPWVARPAAGALWVTDFTNSVLWRVEP